MSLDLPTLLLLVIAIIEGFVGILQLLQMIGTRIAVGRVFGFMKSFEKPEVFEGLVKQITHGVLRAASERAGAVKGAASRQMEAGLSQDVSGLAISGLASFLPKKYQAFAPLLAPYIQGFLEKQGAALPSSNQGQSRNGGIP